jgi:hypothetical protein
VDGAKSCLSEVIWKRIACLSELNITMGKLAELVKWAGLVLQIVLAELGLILLLQSVDLALVSVEAVVVRLIGEASEDLTWWIVEVSWSTIGIKSFSLITSLLS